MTLRSPEQRIVNRVMRRLSRDLRLPLGKDRWRVVSVSHETTPSSPFGPTASRLTVELHQVRP